MRRLWAGALAVIAALVAVLLTGHAAGAVQRPPAAACAHTYAYDSQHHAAMVTDAATERGPPASYEGDTTPDAIGHRPGGALARLSAVSTATITTYDHPAPLVQVARISGASRTGAAGGLVHLSSFERADVAAEDAGPALTRVGRWMSAAEHDAMSATETVQEGAGGVTSVAHPTDTEAVMRQASSGSRYVEFDVPSDSLSPGGKAGWASIRGPNSWWARYGEALPEMPSAFNIEWLVSRL